MLCRVKLNRLLVSTANAPVRCVTRPTATATSSSSTSLGGSNALRVGQRRCATQTEAKTSAQAKVNPAAGAAGGTAEAKAAPHANPAASQTHHHGPQRKDWRTHKNIVYVKGVPAKGSLFKLPFTEQLIICLVFSLAGTGAVYLVRPQIRYLCHHGFLGLTDEAGWKNGPWLYRIMYFMIMFPCYSLILFVCGGLFGRRIWFSFMIHKMWSRFLTRKASTRLAHILDIQHY